MNISGALQKKVFGVPVVYLAALAVAALAYLAYRMPSATPDSGDPDEDGADEDGDPTNGSDDPYGSLASNGTVTVVQGTDPATVTPVVVEDNTAWRKKAVAWIVAQGLATGDTADTAIRLYLDGEQLSVEQGKLRDAAIRQYGLPPEPPDSGGTATPPPTATPLKKIKPPGYHVVQNTTDNQFHDLAKIYYGSDSDQFVDQLQAANVKLGHSPVMPKGTKVFIPVGATPKYYTATRNVRTKKAIAAKNGISQASLQELNDKIKFPAGIGQKVRVK